MSLHQANVNASQNPNHPFKYYDLFGMLSVCVLMISNTVAQKMMAVGPFTLNAAIVIFPITYLVSDIMTEVYGYARARRVTWASIAAVVIMSALYQLVIAMPHIPEWPNQEAFEKVLGATPRIVFASISAILVGDLVNCFVLAKMKVKTEGRYLWLRFIASTFVGQFFDSAVFFSIAFIGVLPMHIMISALLTGWFAKTIYEAVMLPLTYAVVNKLKQAEEIDFYDVNTNFTPFSLEINNDGK